MLTLEECREHLTEEDSESITNAELIAVRDELQTLAEVFVDFALTKETVEEHTCGVE